MVADCQISLLPCSVFNITLMVWVSHTLYALFTLMDTNTKQMVQVLEPALATLLNHPYNLPHDY